MKTFQNVSAQVFDWIIPYYGNKHIICYGTLLVSGIVNGELKKAYCKTQGDKVGDMMPQYIVFEGQRFKVRNIGSMYNPKIVLEIWEKEKIGNKCIYTY